MTRLSKEQQLLMLMRKTLTAIIRDVTPPPGMRHPLSDATIQQVRECLGLIAAREQELAKEQGRGGERPYYSDEPQEVQLVAFDAIKRRPN
ncbi:MAG: segregation and condensation protein A [Thermochromatium sp.]